MFQQSGCDHSSIQQEEDEELEDVVQPMTLGPERGGSTRGAMLDPCTQQDPKLRMEIGICGVTKPDGTEVLEVSHAQARVCNPRVKCSIPYVDSIGNRILVLANVYDTRPVSAHS